MGNTMKPVPFRKLLERAADLSIAHTITEPNDIQGIAALKAEISRIEELAAAAPAPVELDDTEETVTIRIHEWTAWLPSRPDSNARQLAMNSGITTLKTNKAEKLIDIGVTGTGMNYAWDEEEDCPQCEGSGKKSDREVGPAEIGDPCDACKGSGKVTVKVQYGLYAMQAVLAVNMDGTTAAALEQAQNAPLFAEFERTKEATGNTGGRDKTEDLVIIERGQAKPNRAERRASPKRPKR